jgi:mannose-6-phosphate isomerase-like protein (cupin superfamily)
MASRQEMLSRIVSYDSLRQDTDNYLDITLPGHARTAMMLIGGAGVSNDLTLRSPLPPEQGFTMGLQRASTGNGPGLHSHATVEVFMSLSGTWRLYWIDDEGEGEVEFRPWDVASIPAGVWRGLEVTSEEEGVLLAVRGGADGGGLAWHPSILEAAARQGRTVDEEGRLVLEPA